MYEALPAEVAPPFPVPVSATVDELLLVAEHDEPALRRLSVLLSIFARPNIGTTTHEQR